MPKIQKLEITLLEAGASAGLNIMDFDYLVI
jgi:hypothetical protein